MSAVEVIGPDGSIVHFEKEKGGSNADSFGGAVVNLGCLGPVASLTLDVVPEYDVLQAVYGQMESGVAPWYDSYCSC